MAETAEEEVKRLREEALKGALKRLDEKIDILAEETGREVGNLRRDLEAAVNLIRVEVQQAVKAVEEFKRLQVMGQGVVSVTRVAISVMGVVLVVLNIVHIFNHGL